MAECGYRPLNNIYESESARQNTFIIHNWPKTAPIWPILLARAGFYYKGKDLDVTCFSCGLNTTVKDWTRNVHPHQMHFKLNPDCEFIRCLIKPEGGPKTFNDQEKWQKELQKEPTKDSNEICREDNSISVKDEGISIPKENLESKPNLSYNEFRLNDQNNPPSTIQQSVCSEDSGFQTSRTDTTNLLSVIPQSSIAVDSGPAGTNSNYSLLISGGTPFSYQTYLDSGNTYLSGVQGGRSFTSGNQGNAFLHGSSSALSSPLAVVSQSSFTNADVQSAISSPESYNYKHPEMETVSDRIDTFLTWPHKDIQEPRIVATAGFYYTMDHDIVRCFCCDLGLSEWDENDSPWTEHARHSPNCWYLKRVKGQNFIDDIQKDWKKIYNPKFPNLIDEGDRIKTFSNWRNVIVRPTSIDIAKAGFFYTGRGDECRCHYCDGGLQHWESGDNPWEQHAYYFPFCKFVIKMKGRDFINQIRERFVASSPNVDALMRESEEAEAAQTRDDIRERKIKDILNKQEFKDIVNFGYNKKVIRRAAEEVFKDRADFKFTPQHVLNKILDMQDHGEDLPTDDDEEEEEEENEETKKSLLTAAEFMEALEKEEPVGDAEKVIKENKKLKDSLMCLKCGKEQICMLFTPCGHRLVCESCAKSIHHCLKCNKKIKKKYKTYLA